MASLRACSRCIRRDHLLSKPFPHSRRVLSTTTTLRNTNTGSSSNNPLRSGNARTTSDQETARSRRSIMTSAGGIAACAVAMYGMIQLDVFGLSDAERQRSTSTSTTTTSSGSSNGTMKMDGPSGFPNPEGNGEDGVAGHSVIRIKGQDGVDQVDTGTSTVPYFPSTIRLPKSTSLDSDTGLLNAGDEVPRDAEQDEYQLLGLGIRTVSFLRIQVYVVGLYVATPDIAELQTRLVRTALNPPSSSSSSSESGSGGNYATSLVPGERQQLKDLLLDAGENSDAAWDTILKKDGLRTAFRIVPTRNTDFLHLRDGWVRGITGRAQRANITTTTTGVGAGGGADAGAGANKDGGRSEFSDDSFGTALNSFKGLFGGGQRKSVPKGQTLILLRGARGELDALFQPEEKLPARWLGRVRDERVSRLVWLNYLAGKNVASEGARKSVVDGVMAIVERPVGTIVQKVV